MTRDKKAEAISKAIDDIMLSAREAVYVENLCERCWDGFELCWDDTGFTKPDGTKAPSPKQEARIKIGDRIVELIKELSER